MHEDVNKQNKRTSSKRITPTIKQTTKNESKLHTQQTRMQVRHATSHGSDDDGKSSTNTNAEKLVTPPLSAGSYASCHCCMQSSICSSQPWHAVNAGNPYRKYQYGTRISVPRKAHEACLQDVLDQSRHHPHNAKRKSVKGHCSRRALQLHLQPLAPFNQVT